MGSALRNAELLFITFKPSYTLMFLNGQHKVQKIYINVNENDVGGGYYMYSLSQKFSRILIS